MEIPPAVLNHLCSNEPLSRDLAGKELAIAVTVLYPGSRVTDVQIGRAKFQINNADLRLASVHMTSMDVDVSAEVVQLLLGGKPNDPA